MMKRNKKMLCALLAGVCAAGVVVPAAVYAADEIVIDGIPYTDPHAGDNKHDKTTDGHLPNADIDDHGAVSDKDKKGQTDGTHYDKDGHVIADRHEPDEQQDMTVNFTVNGIAPKCVLNLDADKDVFFNCPNINPGDTMSAHVELVNKSKEEKIEFAIWDVVNLLPEDEKACRLLDQLYITIKINGQEEYVGAYSDIAAPIMPWKNIQPDQSAEMEIEVRFPIECDNYYQNSRVFTKWIFLARGDIPNPPKDIDTGQERAGLAGILAALLVLILGGIFMMIRRKKEQDEAEETDPA